MADVVLDTDMASAFQKGRAPDWAVRHVLGARVWLSFVTVGELWKWAEVRSWGGRRRDELEAWRSGRGSGLVRVAGAARIISGCGGVMVGLAVPSVFHPIQ